MYQIIGRTLLGTIALVQNEHEDLSTARPQTNKQAY
jgi:hypothetical protein